MEYITFVLGYDLLNDWFNSLEDAPCDNVFGACKMIAREFKLYDEKHPTECSEYEALQQWLEDHQDFVRYATYYYGMVMPRETFIETCPHCDGENDYLDPIGYVAKCAHCGEEIMLCDKCMHADDNPYMKCDWHEEVIDGKLCGVCFRGITHRKEN